MKDTLQTNTNDKFLFRKENLIPQMYGRKGIHIQLSTHQMGIY